MSPTGVPRLEDLPRSLLDRVDGLCDDFERAWKGGGRPRPEDYLAGAGEAERGPLLGALLRVDAEYRRTAGERSAAGEYLARFPDHEAVVRAAFAEEPTPAPERSTERTVDHPSCPPDEEAIDRAPPPLPRYAEFGEPSMGGMGAVWKCRDGRLRQWVAVKVLKARLRSRPELLRRFAAEAQLTSQLQHPNIPPVHDAGELPDGRPYYCMKWVEGRTLAALLEEVPAGERVAKLLPVFQQVCEALAYAHGANVIHRDLKPSNVMVGAFGEVQVMDWGLAKVLGGAETVGLETEWTAEEATQAGAVLGTLAYVPPEQARAESAAADRRSDVFGLGAMLCEILTGSPPYAGADGVARARAGDVSEAQQRLAACGADAELVGLARVCLQARAEERPADAGEVAERVRAHRLGVERRLRQAEVERAAASARAEPEQRAKEEAEGRVSAERSRRRVTAGLAAAVLLLVAVGGGALWKSQRDRERMAQQARDERADKVRLALWRLDSRVADFHAREETRSFDHYSPIFAAPPSFDSRRRSVQAGTVYVPSPLLDAELPSWALLHFQADSLGWVSPQVPPSQVAQMLRGVEGVSLANVTPRRAELLAEMSARLRPESVVELARRSCGKVVPVGVEGKEGLTGKVVQMSGMVGLWLPGEEERLVLLRVVLMDGRDSCQGILLDWRQLAEVLAEEVRDLFPEARLVPVRESKVEDPTHTMATLPFRLDTGERSATTSGARSPRH